MKDLFHLYLSRYPSEAVTVAEFEALLFMKGQPAFERSHLPGHFTASAWLLSPNQREVLLTHHRKLDLWIQLGGHCDGDPIPERTALREAEEESGISNLILISREIFDLDIHLIPKTAKDEAHYHYDFRFLIQAPHQRFQVSHESKELRWLSIEDSFFDSAERSVQKMHSKWKLFLKNERTTSHANRIRQQAILPSEERTSI